MVSEIRVLQPARLWSDSRLPFHLPNEVLEDVKRRLGFAVGGIGFAILASAAWMAVVHLAGWGSCPPLHFIIYGFGIVSAFALYRLAKRDEASPATLINLALVYETPVAFCTALVENTTPLGHGQFSGLSWVTVLIVFFPVVVPATPLKTGLASTGAASAGLAAGWLMTGSLDVLLMWNSVVAIGLSLIPSLVVSRLGEQLDKAREMGQYVLEERLGNGAMGEVWRASHRLLSRPAAIKLIDPNMRGGGEIEKAFFRKEAWATAQLNSPHTVTVYDFGESGDGRFYYAMELLVGQDLRTRVEERGPLPPDRAVAVLMQACRSLEEAHNRGLVHRDIKPSNLFLCKVGLVDDFVKVVDFGLVIGDGIKREAAKEGGQGQRPVPQEQTYGTPAYIAPEQARGEPIDGRADLYALAGVGYWLLTGAAVFPGSSRAEVMDGHLNKSPPPLAPRVKGARISKRLEAILASCLQKEPQHRPATASKLREQLSLCPEGAWHRPQA